MILGATLLGAAGLAYLLPWRVFINRLLQRDQSSYLLEFSIQRMTMMMTTMIKQCISQCRIKFTSYIVVHFVCEPSPLFESRCVVERCCVPVRQYGLVWRLTKGGVMHHTHLQGTQPQIAEIF